MASLCGLLASKRGGLGGREGPAFLGGSPYPADRKNGQ